VKVLFDTNIVLDVLLNRSQFVENSAALVSLAEQEVIEGYLCATTITTIDYLVSKSVNKEQAKISIQKLLSIFCIAEVNKNVLLLSTESKFTDFEDAVQHYSGKLVQVAAIVTRNINDYKHSEYPAYTPSELLGIIKVNN
jgi:predicted nucleic acid-binding protein